jgi:4-hydroxybenzoate polyprenyltransferase
MNRYLPSFVRIQGRYYRCRIGFLAVVLRLNMRLLTESPSTPPHCPITRLFLPSLTKRAPMVVPSFLRPPLRRNLLMRLPPTLAASTPSSAAAPTPISPADIPVWKAARQGFVVGGNSALDKHANRIEPTSAVFGPFFNSLRPVQWLKNLLIFVPLLAGHKIGDANLLFAAVCAFVAFCLTASAVYIVNDLLDLDADRHHHRKAARPFASGAVPVAAGVIAAPILLIGGIVLGTMFLPPAFIAVLGGYLLLTSLYSFWLKRLVIVDVIVLAGLYTLRIFAGSAATGIAPSFWLLAFSQFIFFSLAIVKRYTELLTKGDSASIVAGRGYYADDLPVLMALGASSGLMAVLVMALYIDSTATTTLYAGRAWLWFIPPPILYWVARLWMKTHRGEVHDDPVIFAARDPVSLIVAAMLMLIFVAAANDWEFW